MVMYPRAL